MIYVFLMLSTNGKTPVLVSRVQLLNYLKYAQQYTYIDYIIMLVQQYQIRPTIVLKIIHQKPFYSFCSVVHQ